MSPRHAFVAALLLVASVCRAQGVDPNLQNLLAGLETGTEVQLVTPLASGMLQIASMLAGGPIDVPAGRIHPRGLLTAAGIPAFITSQLVQRNAAVGGSAPAYG